MKNVADYQRMGLRDELTEEEWLDTWRPRVAPGKVTLTSRLQGPVPDARAADGAAAAVQRKALPEADAAARREDMARWEDAALLGIEPASAVQTRSDPAAHAGRDGAVQMRAAEAQGSSEGPVSLPGHGGGAEMPDDVRAKMEAAFGVDFSSVRIHEGPHAQAVGALAYTQGTDIHFAPGQYNPGSPHGQELLGHELTHVVQQSQGRVRATTQAKGVDINDDASLEREADEMGARAARGQSVRAASHEPARMLLDGSGTQKTFHNTEAHSSEISGIELSHINQQQQNGLSIQARSSKKANTVPHSPHRQAIPWDAVGPSATFNRGSKEVNNVPHCPRQDLVCQATPWDAVGPSATFDQVVDIAKQYSSFDRFAADVPDLLNPNSPHLIRAWNRAHPSVVHHRVNGVHIVEIRGGTPSVLARSSSQTFTGAAMDADRRESQEVTINMNLYKNDNGYTYVNPNDPSRHPAEGRVVSGGRTIGGMSSPDTFYVAYNQGTGDASLDGTWSFGQGDPPTGSTVAFGGGKPLIVNGLPYGTHNEYSADAPACLPKDGDPGPENRQYLRQRSNVGFKVLLDKFGARIGIPIIGYDADQDILLLVAQPRYIIDRGLDITQIRELLIQRGVDSALAFDGASSTTLIHDSSVLVTPWPHKNNTIPFGLIVRTPR